MTGEMAQKHQLTPVEEDFLLGELDSSTVGVEPESDTAAQDAGNSSQDASTAPPPPASPPRANTATSEASCTSQHTPRQPPRTAHQPASTSLVAAQALPAACVSQLQHVERLEQQLAAWLAPDSPPGAAQQGHVCDTAVELCKQYNRAAMRLVEAGHAKHAYHLLEKAQVLCEPDGVLSQHPQQHSALLAATLNNLGVYHQHMGATQQAVQALHRALQVESHHSAATSSQAPATTCGRGAAGSGVMKQGAPAGSDDTCCDREEDTSKATCNVDLAVDAPGSTQLNLCAALSSAGKHSEALAAVCAGLSQLCTSCGLSEHEVVAWACGYSQHSSRAATPCQAISALNHARSEHSSSHADDVAGRATGSGAGKATCSGRGPSNADGQDTCRGVGGGVLLTPRAANTAGVTLQDGDDVTAHLADVPDDHSTLREVSGRQQDGTLGSRLRQLPSTTCTVLAMGLYNKAVQLEHLGEWSQALEGYCAAAGLATRMFGRTSSLSKQFHRSLQAFKSSVRRKGPHAQHRVRAASASISRSSPQVPSTHDAQHTCPRSQPHATLHHSGSACNSQSQCVGNTAGARRQEGCHQHATSTSPYAEPPLMGLGARHTPARPPQLIRRPYSADVVPTLDAYSKARPCSPRAKLSPRCAANTTADPAVFRKQSVTHTVELRGTTAASDRLPLVDNMPEAVDGSQAAVPAIRTHIQCSSSRAGEAQPCHRPATAVSRQRPGSTLGLAKGLGQPQTLLLSVVRDSPGTSVYEEHQPSAASTTLPATNRHPRRRAVSALPQRSVASLQAGGLGLEMGNSEAGGDALVMAQRKRLQIMKDALQPKKNGIVF